MAKKSAKIIEIKEMTGETGLVIIEQVGGRALAGTAGKPLIPWRTSGLNPMRSIHCRAATGILSDE
ncbi:MAG: hypothetical protein LBP74_06990 [Treponema sp.]|nr:hypothetical protein [Treponema sp.]